MPCFHLHVPFDCSAIALRGAILGASNPQNRVNAPENPQAGDFRERSQPSFTNCLICDMPCFYLRAFRLTAPPQSKEGSQFAELVDFVGIEPPKSLGENSCFPLKPFSACYRVLHGFAVSRRFAPVPRFARSASGGLEPFSEEKGKENRRFSGRNPKRL